MRMKRNITTNVFGQKINKWLSGLRIFSAQITAGFCMPQHSVAWLGETAYETGVMGVVISSGSVGLPIFVRKLRGLSYQDKRKLSTTRLAK